MQVEGVLSVEFVEALKYWRLSVAGHPVEPESVKRL